MQQVWRKRWRNSGWLILGAITLVLLAAAINKKNNKICSGIEVAFKDEGSNFFVDEKGVESILKEAGTIKGQPINTIDLKQLEERLKRDRWISNADLFFDNHQVLQVLIEEKEPIARIFTVGGSSFYIDSACRRLPLSEKLSARVPMFTSFPSDRTILSRPDSQLLASIKELALFIEADEFWKAQVSQIDVLPDGFEMIPTVGNHVVALGKEGDWQEKFDRLFSFYKQVWTKIGFEKYEKIDVQFNKQVVATLKGSKPSVVDTAKARVAYETLLADVKRSTGDAVDNAPKPGVIRDTIGKGSPPPVTNKPVVKVNNGASEKLAEVPLVKAVPAKSAVKQSTAKADVKQVAKTTIVKQANNKVGNSNVPKAVMKKKVK